MQKKWKRIDKTRSLKPQQGAYQDWKPQLAEEGGGRCVYCAILDAELGGQRNFHVEHFKPKNNLKFPEFAILINDYDNLFYACAICNTFKSNSWFSVKDGDWNTIHYPNPSLYNYGDFFEITADIFTITGNHIVGEFLIQKLHLNRFQLIRSRRLETCEEKLNKISDQVGYTMKLLAKLIRNKKDAAFDYYEKIAEANYIIVNLYREKSKHSLYAPDELRQTEK